MCAQADAAMRIDAAYVRTADADGGVFDGSSCDIFGCLDRLLNRRHGLVEFEDHAFARAAGVGDTVPAITQAGIGQFDHQRARLGAAHINCRQKTSLLVSHVMNSFVSTSSVPPTVSQPRHSASESPC